MSIAGVCPNAVSEYLAFVDDVDDAVQRVRSTESTILSGNFNAHIGTDSETWKGMIGRHGDPAFNENGRYLLQLCSSNGLCIMNTFFQHRDVHKCLMNRFNMAQKSLIDFCIVWSDLFSEVLNVRSEVLVRVKRGAKLSADHDLVVCFLRFSTPWINRKSRRSSVAYTIKWEVLVDRDVREQFASNMAAKFQQIPEVSEDIKMKWSLFRTAIISSAVKSCGRKRCRITRGSGKRTPWWNQDVKETIRAVKNAFKTLLQNRSSSDLQSRFSEAQKAAAQAAKISKERSWEEFGRQ